MEEKGRNPWRFAFLTLAVICGLFLAGELVSMALVWYLTGNEAATLGIIGGADGPTAVFVTTQMAVPAEEVKFALCLLGLAAGVIGYRRLKRIK